MGRRYILKKIIEFILPCKTSEGKYLLGAFSEIFRHTSGFRAAVLIRWFYSQNFALYV